MFIGLQELTSASCQSMAHIAIYVNLYTRIRARTHHKGKKLPSVHVLGDFNFKDIDWPDRLSKSGSTLSQSEGQILIDIMNDHGLEQMVHFPTREKNTLDLILTTLPSQFQDIHSPDKLSDHDIISGTLKIFIRPIKKPRRKVYLYQKGDYESMRKDTLEFAKKKYFNGHSDTRSVQENFDLLTSFIQDSADKHIPSKTSRSVSSIPWITPEIRRKIRRKNKTHAKAKKTGSSKPCGGRKTSPRTSIIVQFIFYFWSFEISVNILRNQKQMIGLDSYSRQVFNYLDPI